MPCRPMIQHSIGVPIGDWRSALRSRLNIDSSRDSYLGGIGGTISGSPV